MIFLILKINYYLLSKEVKIVVDDKSKYTDWNIREDIKAELKVDLIILLDKHGYPPITKDDVKEILNKQRILRSLDYISVL